jgi:hypothetical protein
LNPFNRRLSPGGSSGGESALIASRGSPLGVGTDIGGSIVSILMSPISMHNLIEISEFLRRIVVYMALKALWLDFHTEA